MTTVRIGGAKAPARGKESRAANKKRPQPKRPYPPPGNDNDGGDPTTKYGVPAGKMGISVQGTDLRLVLPYAPREMTYDGLAHEWEELQRDGGRSPLLVKRQRSLKRVAASIFIGSSSFTRPVKKELQALTQIAKAEKPATIMWSSWENGLWRITSLQVRSQLRNPTSGEITRATVDVEFTRASDAPQNLGPATGGKQGGGKGGGGGGKGGGGKDRPKKYTVKQGDTLQKIGMRFYHDHKAWRKIADANNIRNPKADAALKVGRTLKLP